MAFPFFASDSDLMPVWNESFVDLFELFPLGDFPEPNIPVVPPTCVPCPVGPSPVGPSGSGGSNECCIKVDPSAEFGFSPVEEWEHPAPIKFDLHPIIKTDPYLTAIKSEPEIRPEPLLMVKPDPYPIKSDPFPIPGKDVNLTATDESYELDSALSLSPELSYNSYVKEQMEPFKEDISESKTKRPLQMMEDDMEEVLNTEADVVEEDDPTEGFKLPASKSPIMEAMVVCALNGWGIEILKNVRATSASPAEVVFKVTDFNRYYKISRAICSKQRPTDDLGSRIKSLRRWFVNFPKKKDRCENTFLLMVKPTIAKKVNEIIDRNSRTFGLTKRRRRQ